MTYKPEIGDRVTLTGIVVGVDSSHSYPAAVKFDGAEGKVWIEGRAITQAKVEPKPLAVGDLIMWAGRPYSIIYIKGNVAYVDLPGYTVLQYLALTDLKRFTQ